MLGNTPALWIDDARGDEARHGRDPRHDDAVDRRRRRRPHRRGARARFVVADGFGRRPLRRSLEDDVERISAVAARRRAGAVRFDLLAKASPYYSRRTGPTGADDPLLLYFTSGTTARPKLVVHSHTSYPIGHLSTMFGLGLKPGDAHLNISSPGWAKHAWSSFFAPWNAGATASLALDVALRAARPTLDALVDSSGHSRFARRQPSGGNACISARPQANGRSSLREVNAAGEPVNPGDHRAPWGGPGACRCAIPTGRPRPR